MTRKPKVYLVNPDIIDRFAQGQSCQSIGRHYGVTAETISLALKKAGIHVPRRGRPWTDAELRLALRLRGERKKIKDIADLMGRSWQSVESKLRHRRRLLRPELHMRRRGVDYSEAA